MYNSRQTQMYEKHLSSPREQHEKIAYLKKMKTRDIKFNTEETWKEHICVYIYMTIYVHMCVYIWIRIKGYMCARNIYTYIYVYVYFSIFYMLREIGNQLWQKKQQYYYYYCFLEDGKWCLDMYSMMHKHD